MQTSQNQPDEWVLSLLIALGILPIWWLSLVRRRKRQRNAALIRNELQNDARPEGARGEFVDKGLVRCAADQR